MFPDEPTKVEWDTLAKHLGVQNASLEEQFVAIDRYGEACLDNAYQFLLDNCPPQHRAEFLRRAAQDPENSGFKEFVSRVMPNSSDPEKVWAHAIRYA